MSGSPATAIVIVTVVPDDETDTAVAATVVVAALAWGAPRSPVTARTMTPMVANTATRPRRVRIVEVSLLPLPRGGVDFAEIFPAKVKIIVEEPADTYQTS
ncbi:MAG: hypothetical protein WAT17_02185 [Candidatus Saccharimonadales bacterium]